MTFTSNMTLTQNLNFSIAESDYYFKQILIHNLQANPFYHIIKNCNNGFELINQLYLRQENVFLIDIYMPILSGLEAIKFIRKAGNKTPIIAYSATFQDDVFEILEPLPFVYYCQKKSSTILDILRNYVVAPTKNYTDYLNEWKKHPLEVFKYLERQKKGWYEPTPVEIQIMKLCYEGLSNKEIGSYLNLSHRTIDTYIAKLTQKLGLRNKIDLIRFCVEQGYYNSST